MYWKSWIGHVCPSVRLHDNFWKESPIEMKFSLNNILVEFEDENDRSRNGSVIEKILIIDQIILFSKKNLFLTII